MYELVLILDEAADFAKKKSEGNNERFGKIFETKAVEILQEEEKLIAEGRGAMLTHFEPFEGLQRERENAMYVEADLKEQRISSPRRFRKSKAERYISDVKDRLEILKHEVGKRKSVADREVGREIIRMMLSKSEGEQKKKLLEWYGITEKELES